MQGCFKRQMLTAFSGQCRAALNGKCWLLSVANDWDLPCQWKEKTGVFKSSRQPLVCWFVHSAGCLVGIVHFLCPLHSRYILMNNIVYCCIYIHVYCKFFFCNVNCVYISYCEKFSQHLVYNVGITLLFCCAFLFVFTCVCTCVPIG